MKRREFLKRVALFTLASSISPTLSANNLSFDSRYFEKIENFDKVYDDDIFIDNSKMGLLNSITQKLDLLQNTIGHSNFSLISFDEAIKYIKNSPKIEPLTKEELSFCEEIFYFDAKKYGFLGQKPLINLTDKINEKEIIKIPNTGQYLFRGAAENLYQKIKKEIGDTLILTSGIRGITKQFHLFFKKSLESNGNFSLTSRCLAPPGYSFHGIGDFDVGKNGLGVKNFTIEFAKTDEYKKLIELGYVNIRYYQKNLLGVQFEPWHIKVV